MTDDQLDPVAPLTGIRRRPKSNTSQSRKVAASVAVGVVVLWIGFLVFLILSKGSDIGTPASSSSAAVAANERMLQMVQWTIATILTLGGALIGLNWYQSERRYQDDKCTVDETLAEVQALVDGLKHRFFMLASASVESLTQLAIQEIKQGAEQGYAPIRPPVDFYIAIFRNQDENILRRIAAIRLIVEEALHLKIRDELTDSAAQPFREVYPDIVAHHNGLATQLAQILIVPEGVPGFQTDPNGDTP